MSNRTQASALRWLFFCATCISALNLRAQEPKQFVVIETWVATIDLPKLHALNFTWDQVGTDGQIRTIKIADILEGKANNAQILQQPEELLNLLRQAGVARVLAEPKVATVSGRTATLEIGRPENAVKIEATPVANAKGQIRMDFKVEINEPAPSPGGLKALLNRDPPGKRHSQMSFLVDSESGMVSLGPALIRGMPNSPTPLPIVLVRATLQKPESLVPTLETANATYREIR